ncbi:MAG TPA: sigma-70 family RNA polymerase sigma factor [Solirubrobacteraceae bacterium]
MPTTTETSATYLRCIEQQRASAPPRPPSCQRRGDDALSDLVTAARAGDNAAWARLIDRFDSTLRSIARSYRLQPSDIDEVVQMTWARLYEHIDRLRQPNAIAGWLATTARRHAMAILQIPTREHLTDNPQSDDLADPEDPQTSLLRAERYAALADAMDALPEHQRRLMVVLLANPMLDYQQISALLHVPIGSIGPTRARSLTRLSRHPRLRALHDDHSE